ncbi:MAG: hypothetical protein ABIZ91_02940 [Gemmatimonadaceae bacterium]
MTEYIMEGVLFIALLVAVGTLIYFGISSAVAAVRRRRKKDDDAHRHASSENGG